MERFDFIIVGQGLAGTLVAYELMQRSKTVLVVDNQHFESATKVAAGLINPITGRRIVKSEQIDELLPVAKQTYLDLEVYLGIKLWYERNILWCLNSIKEENEWYMRATQANMEHYFESKPGYENYLPLLNTENSFGEIKQSAQANISLLIATFAEKMKQNGCLIQEDFDYKSLKIKEKAVEYKEISAEKIIFCEGHRGRFNPFFNELPFQVAKGEALVIEAQELPDTKILKHGVTLCPLGNNLFWVGANYEWNPKDSLPTESVQSDFEQQLSKFLKVPYKVVEHRAAIRPTTKSRQILIKQHEKIEQMYMFNGLGTKGTSLAPFWANYFVEKVLHLPKIQQ